MTEKEYDKWVKAQIVDRVMKRWGPGWNRLSLEMREDALMAEVSRNMMAQARFDQVENEAEAAADLGRHAAAVARAICRVVASWSEA